MQASDTQRTMWRKNWGVLPSMEQLWLDRRKEVQEMPDHMTTWSPADRQEGEKTLNVIAGLLVNVGSDLETEPTAASVRSIMKVRFMGAQDEWLSEYLLLFILWSGMFACCIVWSLHSMQDIGYQNGFDTRLAMSRIICPALLFAAPSSHRLAPWSLYCLAITQAPVTSLTCCWICNRC